jgi:hypothetical protein
MNTLGTVALATSIALMGCGSTDDPQIQHLPGTATGGYPQAAGGATAAGGVPAGTGAAVNAGGTPTGAGSSVGAGGNAPAAGGTTGQGGALPSTGGVPAAGGSVTATGGTPGAGGVVVDPPDPDAKVFTMQKFTVQPGGEVFMCQNYDNPFGGKDAAVSKVVTDMSSGSHHLHIFYGTQGTSRNIESCSGVEFHPLLHAAGRPHSETVYPAGMAAKVTGNTGLRLQVHYLNTTSDPLEVNVTARLSTVDPSTVTKWIAELYFNRLTIKVPPGGGTKIATTCTIPQTYGPVGLIGGGSHMHSRGVHFVATTSTGVKLIETNDWAEPQPVTYDPPILLNPGDKITWECTYDNPTNTTFDFGESAEKNEMCIYLARFYSSPSGKDMECQATLPTN